MKQKDGSEEEWMEAKMGKGGGRRVEEMTASAMRINGHSNYRLQFNFRKKQWRHLLASLW